MNATSAWLSNANTQLNDAAISAVFEQQALGYSFKVFLTGDSCWLVVHWPKGSRVAFRLAYSPNDQLQLKKVLEKDQRITFKIGSLMGDYEVVVILPAAENPVLRLTTTLHTAAPILFPYWPRDIVPLGAAGSDLLAEGEIKVSQVGTRSGQLYFSLTRPKAGSVFLSAKPDGFGGL
jgi:hypothetical protein